MLRSPKKNLKSSCNSATLHKGSVIAAVLENVSEKVPLRFAPVIRSHVIPIAIKAGDLLDRIYPTVRLLLIKLESFSENVLKPYAIDTVFASFFLGFVLCFFGGHFITLIAAVECIRFVVWERMYESFKLLLTNYNIAHEASKKDDAIDADKDGVRDVLEMTSRELLSRKVYLFIRTVDPDQVTTAVGTLWACFLSVVATLRLHFAQTLTFGCSIAEVLIKHLKPVLDPVLLDILPPELKRIAPSSTVLLCRIIGCVIVWSVHRMVAAFYSAVKGADIIVTNACTILAEKGYLHPSFVEKNSPKMMMLTILLSSLSFYWQLSHNFTLPFPINILLFPFSVTEYLLSWFTVF